MIAPPSKWVRAFFCTSIIIIVAGVISKVAAVLQGDGFLVLKNTVFPFFSNRLVFLVAAGVEAVCVVLMILTRPVPIRAYVILWLASAFIVYRIGVQATGNGRPCGCLGYVGKALGVGDKDMDKAARFALGYMLVGSLGVIVAGRRGTCLRPQTETANQL
jgi:hypothetical protein